MLKIMIPLGLALVGTQAVAQERIRADQLTCQQVQSTINRAGAAIVRYPSARKPSLILFDRYVAGDGQCARDEQAVGATVPTRDNARCLILRCEEEDPLFEDLFGDN